MCYRVGQLLAQCCDSLTHRSAKRSSSSSSGSVILDVSGNLDLLFGDIRKHLRRPVSDAELVASATASSRTVILAVTSSDG